MALDNYDNLKEAIKDFSHRNDITTRLDDFIQLAEQEMYANQVEPLRIRDMEQTSSSDTSTSVRTLALPTGFEQIRSITIDDKSSDAQPYELLYRTPETLPISNAAGTPVFFSVTSQIEFERVPDAVYNIDIIYFGSLTGLSDANTTNAVLTNYPSIYLSGALWALYQWSMQLDLADYHYNRFIGAIKGANLSTDLGRHGPAPTIAFDGEVV